MHRMNSLKDVFSTVSFVIECSEKIFFLLFLVFSIIAGLNFLTGEVIEPRVSTIAVFGIISLGCLLVRKILSLKK